MQTVKIVIHPFLALVIREGVDTTGGIVHGPRPFYVLRDGVNGREYVHDKVGCLALNMPPCCWAEHDAPPAERLYAAYYRSGVQGTFGKAEGSQTPAPTWAELKALVAKNDPRADREVLRWEETARWAIDFLPPFVRESAPERPAQPYIN